MPSNSAPNLSSAAGSAAHEAGLVLIASGHGSDFHGGPTSILELGLSPGAPSAQRTRVELSDSLDLSHPGLLPALSEHMREEAKRLRNPQPAAFVTLGGIPVVMSDFRWPFHRSVSGADTYIVHGTMALADGQNSGLHAKIAASMTVTFAEEVLAPEQPYAETFIYNAIRKTLDQGQLELLKSGNRQPVPVTTRYYSRWQKKFVFTDTDDEARQRFLLSKVFWLSGILGGNAPVWIADPRDAQYLNTTVEALAQAAGELSRTGMVTGEAGEFAAASPALMAHGDEYRSRLEDALAFTKPTFNEEMRAGHTNM
jgi:hypothetical protein